MYRIEIRRRDDPRGKFIKEEFKSFGLDGIEYIEVRDIYYLHGDLSKLPENFYVIRLLKSIILVNLRDLKYCIIPG